MPTAKATVKMPVCLIRGIGESVKVPANEAGVPIYLSLKTLVEYLDFFYQEARMRPLHELGKDGTDFLRRLDPAKADTLLFLALGSDAGKYATTVSKLAGLNDAPINAALGLLEQRVSVLLQAATGERFANEVIAAREFYRI